MSVWFCIPSARPPEQVLPVTQAWHERGYKVALWRDTECLPLAMNGGMDFSMTGGYPGYAQAVNSLAAEVLKRDPACDWVVTGGDDTLPDPDHTAEGIAKQCSHHFEFVTTTDGNTLPTGNPATFGVMQPTGDRFAGGCIDRIAGSPWLGREWCLRANGGSGPYWPEFTHMFGDECLKRTAEKLGVYWARPDLVHKHNHFQRESDAIDARAVQKPVPPHLAKWNTRAHWDEMQAIFRSLEAEDFAPCMPK